MESDQIIDVGALDDPHRRALEEVIGRRLNTNQRLIISVTEAAIQPNNQSLPSQSLDDWISVYDGLSDAEIESIDKIAKT
jgi:hypothetical protein